MKNLEDLITRLAGLSAPLTVRSSFGEGVEPWTLEAANVSAHGQTIDEGAANLLEALSTVEAEGQHAEAAAE